MKLVIVESPTKARTIKGYLGKDFWVIASNGHIRDLATTGEDHTGVDVTDHFRPTYECVPGKKGLIDYLKKQAEKADVVYLATDPDREGEAISWHIADSLGLDVTTTPRLEFHEITKRGIETAKANERLINMQLVESQETRRILDRIIGFKLSTLLQAKIHSRSAGRVQSAALSLIVDRENEIEKFEVVSSFIPTVVFKTGTTKFSAHLVDVEGKKIKFATEEEAQVVIDSLGDKFKLARLESEDKEYHSRPPYTTSTLQQDAFNFFHFGAKKTNRIAQKLYEGVDIGDETTGLITYMRTDSVRISPSFIFPCKDYIKNTYGEEYVGFVKGQKANDNVQNAHEAIRPTDAARTPESIQKYLSPDEFKVYSLIWARAVGSLMKARLVKQTSAIFENNNYLFAANGSELLFEGYLKVLSDFDRNEYHALPEMEIDSEHKANKLSIEKEDTAPPPRFTEARLIKTMEELGIGRPSTYATVVETLKQRRYVEVKKSFFVPTEQGKLTTGKLREFFNDIINVEYTAQMEKNLDEIAEGIHSKEQILSAFYTPFSQTLDRAWGTMEKTEKVDEAEKLDRNCPSCGSQLVRRKSKYGSSFVGCSNFPKCKFIEKTPEEEKKQLVTCPRCQKGHLVSRRGRFGLFYGCSNYPKCDYVEKKS